jgi:N6-L-threonylcarbamoyladenine synthase
MRVLGIETSCDESAVAILEGKGDRVSVLDSIVSSQIEIHEEYGGVVPEVAARNHALNLPIILKRILGKGREKAFDAVAVTSGPGLITSLRVGTDTARVLAYAWGKPLVGVNHLEGHIYANWIGAEPPKFPALALIVSGGHTELVLMRGHGDYLLLGATRDDAVGEAFDKVAKVLHLGYPGGPKVAKLAEKGRPEAIAFPRPMIASKDYDFSYSGLKTAVLVETNRARRKKADVCASFQAAAIEVLVEKTVRAVKEFKPKTVLLAGGVSANLVLRKALGRAVADRLPGVAYREPDLAYTTDNASMIAAAGYFALKAGKRSDWRTLDPQAHWEIGV